MSVEKLEQALANAHKQKEFLQRDYDTRVVGEGIEERVRYSGMIQNKEQEIVELTAALERAKAEIKAELDNARIQAELAMVRELVQPATKAPRQADVVDVHIVNPADVAEFEKHKRRETIAKRFEYTAPFIAIAAVIALVPILASPISPLIIGLLAGAGVALVASLVVTGVAAYLRDRAKTAKDAALARMQPAQPANEPAAVTNNAQIRQGLNIEGPRNAANVDPAPAPASAPVADQPAAQPEPAPAARPATPSL